MKSSGNGFSIDRATERARWVTQYRGSGLSLKEFAEQHGLSAGQLRYWVYEPGKAQRSEEPGPVFHEVHLSAAALKTGSWVAEISWPDGMTVRVTRETDVAWASALIDSLRRPCLSR